jgi:hypothetical protein
MTDRRRPPACRQRDITAVIKAARAAGCEISRVEVDPITGRITIMIGAPNEIKEAADLDKWLAQHAC